MDQDRNVGVREARLSLALVICCLLAAGYVTLHLLAGAGRMPPVEVRPGLPAPSYEAAEEDSATELAPQVLTIETSDSPIVPLRTSQRPDAVRLLEGSPDAD